MTELKDEILKVEIDHVECEVPRAEQTSCCRWSPCCLLCLDQQETHRETERQGDVAKLTVSWEISAVLSTRQRR